MKSVVYAIFFVLPVSALAETHPWMMLGKSIVAKANNYYNYQWQYTFIVSN